jgi:hypothetical protein
MMYINLIWTWGHPEVYILILPPFGVFSEVIATFSRKPLFGYRSMVVATMVITVFWHSPPGCITFSRWGPVRRRQWILRHHYDGDRHTHGCEDLQLALHDVWRPGAL